MNYGRKKKKVHNNILVNLNNLKNNNNNNESYPSEINFNYVRLVHHLKINPYQKIKEKNHNFVNR